MEGFHRVDLPELLGQTTKAQPKKTLLERANAAKFDRYEPVATETFIFNFEDEDSKNYKVAPAGGLVIIAGKSKSRKSSVLGSVLASCIDRQNHLGFQISLKENETALWIDTEMQKGDFQRLQHRILYAAGQPTHSNLQAYGLVKFTAIERLDIVDALIAENPTIKVLVLDGIVDCMQNFNSLQESNDIVSRVQYWQGLGILVILVIHLNLANGQWKMRGHIGTLLEAKANCVIEIARGEAEGTGVISCKVSRQYPFPSIDFSVDENNVPIDKTQKVFLDAAKQLETLGSYPTQTPSLNSLSSEDCPF